MIEGQPFDSEFTVKSHKRSSNQSAILVGLGLILVLLLGGYFRFVGQNWDDFTHLHPDERFLTGVVSALGGALSFTDSDPAARSEHFQTCLDRYPDNKGVGGYFDSECSTLNPHNVGRGLYVYGTLPTFITKWTADVAAEVTGDTNLPGYNGAQLVGRTLSAIADVLVIALVFLIGRRLHGKGVGLLAAALYAFAVFPIQQAHFATVDAMTNLFVVLAIFFALRVQDGGQMRDYLGFGLVFAMALAGRVNTLPLVGLVGLAAMLRMLPALDERLPWGERQRLLVHNGAGLILAGIVTAIGFRIFQPYAFSGPGFFDLLPNERWLDDIGTARHLISGAAESPPNWQWVGRINYLFPFNNMVVWGMGAALGLTAWLTWLWSGWRLLRGRRAAMRHLLPFAWVLVYFGWLGNQWVMTMRYYLPLYPIFAIFAAWGLLELVKRTNLNVNFSWRRIGARVLLVGVPAFTLLWAAMFTNIYRNQLTRVQASHWVWENVPGDFAMRIENADPATPLINIPIFNSIGEDNNLLAQASQLFEGQPFTRTFVAPADGVVTTVYAPHLGDPFDDGGPESLAISISEVGNTAVLTDASLTANFTRDEHVLGNAYEIPLNRPLAVEAGKEYSFTVGVVSGGPVVSAGAIVSHEGAWDDPVPTVVCTLPTGVSVADSPPPGLLSAEECRGRNAYGDLINGYNLSIAFEDVEFKRETLIEALDNSDYLTISSNRFYDAEARIASRWPMTLRYYDALFSGELGFEPVAVFQETFELGPLRVSDQHLPTSSSPDWLNEFEAEEAFHVYDHPVVFIFQKTENYASEHMRDILTSVSLNKLDATLGGFNDPTIVGAVPLYSLPADEAPTGLQLSDELREIQYNNGAWYERFARDAVINTEPIVTVGVWWLVIVLFGWLAWPLLFVLFPALGDRGFGFAKLIGMVLTAWMTWLVASARVPLWSRLGIILASIALLTVGVVLVWRQRGEFVAYIRDYWRRLLLIEAITLAAFVVFLFIRLSNPDLWHPAFGGEKPMDFAYFNAVLRSSVFPALDPWYAGGYINYYYFGFVIVGTPVLLLGVVPSIAYNLIIPTWFALTGIAAFSVAFNVVNALKQRRATTAGDNESSVRSRAPSLGNPYVAGIAALMLAVVLGNLDTVRVFGNGVAQAGFYNQPERLQVEYINDYINDNGIAPLGDDLVVLQNRAVADSASWTASMVRGAGEVLGGAPLPTPTNRWYWAPTRIIAENVGGNAITEIPFFTFLYGDLHAHLIAMPMLLFIMAFLLNEILAARRDGRSRLAQSLAFGLGALFVGLLRATNTWDWPTFLLLGTLGMGYIWWLNWGALNRRSLINLGVRVGGFAALHALLTLPYIANYAAVYGSASIWEGARTPIWAYLDLNGLFLFLIVSLLFWETARWFGGTYVRSLRGMWPYLLIGGAAAVGILLGLLALLRAGYPVALIALPLLIWISILFFRPRQTRVMQFILALAGLAVGLTLGVEFIVLDGDIGRQNTVFKFYIQAWLLFSVVGGAAFAWLLQASWRWRGLVRNGWVGALAVLVIMAGLYPVLASRARSIDRMSPETGFTLDGMDYMKNAVQWEGDPTLTSDGNLTPFSLADDYNMIRWLQDNVAGTPVIIEGRSDREYRWGSRVSIYTGMPSVLGWNWHQRQQRTFDPMPRLVFQREANINAFYNALDQQTAVDILRHYDVSYIIVGSLEKAYYPAASLAKFDRMADAGLLDVIYRAGEATVYHVNKETL